MPETFGKRQRQAVKERKAAAREERRVARQQRRDDRAAGVLEPGPPVEANVMEDFGVVSEPEQAETN